MIVLKAKFDPGNVVATKAVVETLTQEYAMAALARHVQGQWGLVNEDSRVKNNKALRTGKGDMLSVYPLEDDPGEFWIMTQGEGEDRITTILLPEDY